MFLEVVAVLSVVCGKEAARYDELVMTMMEEGVRDEISWIIFPASSF